MKYNFKKKYNGFTLIELLAVIIILAIIALIAVPVIMNIIDKAKKSAFEDSAYGILKASELYYADNLLNDNNHAKKFYGPSFDGLEVKGDKPASGTVSLNELGQTALILISDKWIAYKKLGDNSISIDENKDSNLKKIKNDVNLSTDIIVNGTYKDKSGANIPKLSSGMIPIYFEGNTAKKADINENWYDYNNKKWANAVLVTNATRDKYKNDAKGTNITETDVLAYLVWIPKYKYKLFNTAGAAGTTPISIDIKFQKSTDPKEEGTTDGSYLTAPGFTFGNQELSGIWVGKFETTGNGTTPTIKPNVPSLRSQNVSTQFKTAQLFNDNSYGLSGMNDVHMMKDEEWGAVAYLSHSKYGIDKQVRINNNNGYRTGCGASIEDGAASANCEITYGMVNEYPQSTTGNITGIFDMSGGAYEYTMGVLADPNGKPRSGYTSRAYTETQINGLTGITSVVGEWNSGYNGMVYGKSELGETSYKTNGESFPHEKYYTLYQTSKRLTACGGKKCLGKTLVETNNWYGDFNYFILASSPWFVRGGCYSYTTGSGLFSFNYIYGTADSALSFRVVFGFPQ